LTRGVALLLAALVLAWSGAWGAGLVWDDHSLVEANTVLDAPTLADVFGRDLWCCTGGYASPYFRPVMTVSLLVDRWLLGGHVGLAHLHSLAWHLLAVVLVYHLVRDVAGGPAGLVAAGVFGLHPVQSEAVYWISARNDLLVGALSVAALLAATRDRPVLAAVAALLAALSKESGLLVPLAALAWGMAWERPLPRRSFIGLAFGAAVAAWIRQQATLGLALPPFPFGPDTELGYLWAAVRGLGWLVWPWPLTGTTSSYGVPPPAGAWLAALVALVGLGLAVRRVPRRALGLLAFVALTAGPSAMGVVHYQTLGERYLYLPTVATAALVGSLLPLGRPVLVLLGAGGLLSAALLQVRARDWTDDLSFFAAAAARQPDAYSHSLHGHALLDAGRPAEALAAFEASLRVEPGYPFACRWIAPAGRAALDWPALRERAQAWIADDCQSVAGFDDTLLSAAALAGDWTFVERLLVEHIASDRSGRAGRVQAARLERDGDLLGSAEWALQTPSAGEFRASLHPYLQPLAAGPPPQ